MKRNLWIIIMFSVFFLIGGFFYINSSKIIRSYNNYWVSIKGAVYNESRFKVKENTKVKEVIYKAHLLISSDLSQINMNRIIRYDEDIYIPFQKGKEPKIDAQNGLSKSEIDQLGLSKNLSKALFELFIRKNNYVTWNEIDELPGTGLITMQRLRSLLIIRD